MKNTPLSEKLILYFVLLGLGAILIISTVSFYGAKMALKSRTFDQLTSLRILKKKQVGQFYADRVRDITIMATTTTSALDDGKYPVPLELWLGAQYFTAYYVLGQQDVITQGSFNLLPNSKPPAISGQSVSKIHDMIKGHSVIITDLFMDSLTGHPCQYVAAEIKGLNSGARGSNNILVLSISMEAINAIMLDNSPLNGLGLSGETYLVGPDYLLRSTSRFQPRPVLKTLIRTKPVLEALAGRDGFTKTTGYRNIPVFSSYDNLAVPGLSWAIVAEIDVREAMAPVYKTLMWILLLSLTIMAIFFAFVLFISRRITTPLKRLKDATINLGRGHYDLNLPVTTHDEIGALTESFNLMARQIKEKTNELQQERFGRMRSVIDGEEMERQRLSRELHDGIGQQLIAITLRLESLLYQEGKDIGTSIKELKKYFDQIIDEVRRISNNLMPSVLELFSIPIAFRNLFSETEEHSGLRIHFEAKGYFDDLDKKLKTYIYRLTQEALTNIVKHAEAREVWVTLNRNPDNLALVIRDNGRGFIPDTASRDGGNGIHNMRERVSLLHGQIGISSVPGKGTTITVNVPIIIINVKNQDFPRG
jgi:signal transduction histidine kinase